MNSWEAFYGPNVGYALEQYERYLADPQSVDAATRTIFQQMDQVGDAPGAVSTLARLAPEPSGPNPATTNTRNPASNGKQLRPTAANQVSSNGSAVATRTGSSRLPHAPLPAQVPSDPHGVHRIVAAARLARSIREYGHLDARIDPLGSSGPGDPMLDPHTHGITNADLAELPASIVFPAAGPEAGTCRAAIHRLCSIYCGSIGYEFDHVQNFDERAWLYAMVEEGTFGAPLHADQRRTLLRSLTQVEALERFLHTTFQGQKRFSIEGNDTLIPMLDQIVNDAAETNVGEVLIGMAHRGRLNVLAHVLNRPYGAIFAEFRGAVRAEEPRTPRQDWVSRVGGGDVKYHRGGHRVAGVPGHGIAITLADNPSHLEYVNPVVQGFARAAQDDRSGTGSPRQDVARALAITIHGDAAFPGEGVVAETLNLSRLPGYRTGGTLHIIVNNQVGFTTTIEAGRSTLYASDLAKGFEVPIVHVNADDPEACLTAVKLAYAYRHRFHKDFLVDLVGYRRWGHNETDEPSFTQPRMYAQITAHPTARALYAEQLAATGVVSQEDADSLLKEAQRTLRDARDQGGSVVTLDPTFEPSAKPAHGDHPAVISDEDLRTLNEALLVRPDGFTPNAKLDRVLTRRRENIDRLGGIDWAQAETLALASILADGVPIRFAGQDTQRGTFSQRHLVLHDSESGRALTPLAELPQARASFAVYNSPLTEAAVLGFEYGYSVHAPDTLVIWEAQYGDFANAGQVLIDQFIVAARNKWQKQPAIALLLPHGYEGQGPEHSSARLERYLQLCADDNIRVVNPTTAAQYFHLLRTQAASLSGERRPLIVMTPKSLLRRAESSSSLADLSAGHFQAVIDDAFAAQHPEKVRRLVLCSGKVAVDLATTAGDQPVEWVAVARVEQLYPFPRPEIRDLLARYPQLTEVIWLQEEPRNMGAWDFVALRLQEILPSHLLVRYIGRKNRASTAEGSPDLHEREQARIVAEAYDGEHAPNVETQRDQDVD